jgi:taurine dioxygenase
MSELQVRDLRDELRFGSLVDGVNWTALEDESVKANLRELLKARGLIVFKELEPTAAMQIAVSKVFGPLKDHPTATTARDPETGDAAPGVIDMHSFPPRIQMTWDI